MAILMPKDTADVLGENAARCESRALYFDRFCDPLAKADERNRWFSGVIARKSSAAKIGAWKSWLGSSGLGLKSEAVLWGKLQSRMMVNMAGGVMENAGLCLDRFGVPFIPGSSVKGCARRMAIQTLLEEREAQLSIERLAGRLAHIALIFGWGELDWSEKKLDSRQVSDFAYAVGSANWQEVAAKAKSCLPSANQFGGTAAFLPAYPLRLPAHDLELDVLTCHHPKYYQGDPKMTAALDVEEPNPVKFPAVGAGMIFQFVVLPIRGHGHAFSQPPDGSLQVLALKWLRQGLETFGLGAKTAAGYGWFDASEEFNQQMIEEEMAEAVLVGKRQAEEAEKLRLKQAEVERLNQRSREKQMLASLTPAQQDDYQITQLTPEQFRSKLDNFLTNKVESEKQAIVRALRLEPAAESSRRTSWEELKAKAQKKGGKWAQIEQSIRQISRQLNLGKMP